MAINSEIENKAKILVIGSFGPNDIVLNSSDHRMNSTPELEARIDKAWAPKAARGWFPGPVVRLESFGLNNGIIELTTGLTDFREYTGTRDLSALREYGFNGIANPISVSATVITADHKIMVSQKLQKDALGSIDAIGGYLHPEKDKDPSSGLIDVFKGVQREIDEETGLKSEDLTDLYCLGLSYEYAGLCHPVLSFVARTSLTTYQIRQRRGDQEVDLCLVNPEKIPTTDGRDDPDFIMTIISNYYPNVEPDGRITIALARKWLSGDVYHPKIVRGLESI